MCQKLPNEIFLKIFKNLSHTDLLKVSEVSKRFCDNATDPSLWKDFNISHRTLNDKFHLLQLSRFKKLKTLTLTVGCSAIALRQDLTSATPPTSQD